MRSVGDLPKLCSYRRPVWKNRYRSLTITRPTALTGRRLTGRPVGCEPEGQENSWLAFTQGSWVPR